MCGDEFCNVMPNKKDDFRITLETDKPPARLLELFDDMVNLPGLDERVHQKLTTLGANVISFQYYNGAVAEVRWLCRE